MFISNTWQHSCMVKGDEYSSRNLFHTGTQYAHHSKETCPARPCVPRTLTSLSRSSVAAILPSARNTKSKEIARISNFSGTPLDRGSTQKLCAPSLFPVSVCTFRRDCHRFSACHWSTNWLQGLYPLFDDALQPHDAVSAGHLAVVHKSQRRVPRISTPIFPVVLPAGLS